jgi:hypothetical protein
MNGVLGSKTSKKILAQCYEVDIYGRKKLSFTTLSMFA